MSDSEGTTCIAAFRKSLDDAEARISALRARAAFGPKARPAIGVLESQVQDRDPFVRCGGLLALHSVGDEAVTALALGLRDPAPMNVELTAQCAERMGASALKLLPELEKAMLSRHPGVRQDIAGTIQTIRDAP